MYNFKKILFWYFMYSFWGFKGIIHCEYMERSDKLLCPTDEVKHYGRKWELVNAHFWVTYISYIV